MSCIKNMSRFELESNSKRKELKNKENTNDPRKSDLIYGKFARFQLAVKRSPVNKLAVMRS